MIYVVVLNWNGWSDTIACAESVLRSRRVPFRLVICDNASTDDSIAKIHAWAAGAQPAEGLDEAPPDMAKAPVPKPLELVELTQADVESDAALAPAPGAVVLIRNGANHGYAGGNNVGIRYAQRCGDMSFVWVLNNDTVVQPDALSALVARASSDASIGIVGSTLIYYHQPTRCQAMAGCRFSAWTTRISPIGQGRSLEESARVSAESVEGELSYVSGASMLVSRPFLEDVGLMQEDYFLYFEEIDWAERARRSHARWKLGYAPASVVYHKVGASAGTSKRSEASLRYFYGSKLKFMRRFFPYRTPVIACMVAAQALKAAGRGRTAEARIILSVLGRSLVS